MKARHIAGHLLFWMIIMLTYAASAWGYRNNFQDAILFECLSLPVRLLAVYINWFVLIPRLLYKNKILKYLLLLLLLLFILAIAQRYFTLYWAYPVFFPESMTDDAPQPLLFFRIVQTIVVIATPVAFSMGIKMFLDWYDQKNKARQLTIEKREAELKYLKAQINPHFLFNTLNNLYGLSLEQSQKVPSLILKLSDLLSYSLYESSVEQVSLGKEIKLIQDFIALEKERHEDRLKVDFIIENNLDSDIQIAPLLFMPLVENAFKHGVNETIVQTKVSIYLSFKKSVLTFKVQNTLPDIVTKKSTSGIGLKNLQRRLDLLYPERYVLEIHNQKQIYSVVLKLNCNE